MSSTEAMNELSYESNTGVWFVLTGEITICQKWRLTPTMGNDIVDDFKHLM